MSSQRRFRLAVPCAAVLLVMLPAFASGQDAPALLERRGDAATELLFGVKDAAVRLDAVAVLTEPAPAVHLFPAGQYEAWGDEGRGPAELSSPVDLDWVGADVMVLDINQHKLVTYGSDGAFKGSRSLGDAWAKRFYVVGGDTLLGTFVPMTRERAIQRIRHGERTTVVSYETSDRTVRLEAFGAPSLTVPLPFTPQPHWTVTSDGLIALWSPGRDGLDLLDRDGRTLTTIEGVGDALEVRPEDREHWFRHAIPSEFMGRPVFDPLRPVAREAVEFPEHFPPVLELAGDTRGGVWIRKSTQGSGELWVLLSRDGEEQGSLRFPAGRQVLAFGEDRIVALTVDDLEIEIIEVYAVPRWAR
ncbi:MAG: hypothetical protein GWN99_06490 [Gemmatimonadetes bacterium]|uniref:6-bladed beta-propeller n=1 Tax=Candidatus Kutchimonas denitrificans TaxID=3056748 RepID=A0AAE4Z8Z3_9BACT|nr:hypothetical protein [Gemmatimonadota bacterium]NIR73661.1 hypothetical protein [Candidatus Kutchimonas denitrificans]NIS00711.1 hypothetical protein [Gemmatimonadota bacterium]NIT66298.1 hypothetical protein [Gemmatimonadota bacterium]NIU51516.1 hypothetical protein [Gemmatimonadota bacterium]